MEKKKIGNIKFVKGGVCAAKGFRALHQTKYAYKSPSGNIYAYYKS